MSKGLSRSSKITYGSTGPLTRGLARSDTVTVKTNRTGTQIAKERRLYNEQLSTLSFSQRQDLLGVDKLSPEELAARKADWLRDVKAGVLERKHRDTRSDKGVKRKAPENDDDEEDGDGGDNDNGAGGSTAAPPKPKRRRVTAKLPAVPIVEEPASETETTPKEVPVAARKGRKPAAKNPAATKAAKAPAKRAPAKSKKTAPRDDEVTRAAARATKAKSDAYRAQKEAERAATAATQASTDTQANDAAPAATSRPQPRPLTRPAHAGTKVVSKAFITSDDERDADPDADEDDDTPLPRPRRRYGAPITSDDELDDEPDADKEDGNDAGAAIA
ncbi:hypothetical protein B0H11DRAFT_1916336 [Mycena galericulata]|nr:hypothetical protein B0H11DRAFT_1916336 [Mycena galericulata]